MQNYEQFADASFVRIVHAAPELAARMGIAGLAQFADLEARLDDRSIAADFARRDLLDQIHAKHRCYDRAALDLREQLTFDVFEFFLRYLPFEPWAGVAGRDFVLHHYPVRHVWGAPAETFNLLANMHAVASEADAHAFIARLEQLGPMTRGLIEGLDHRDAERLSPPRDALAIVRKELEAVDASSVIGDRDAALQVLAAPIVEKFLRGPLAELVACLKRLEATAAEPPGVWRLPRGDEFYRYSLTRETSTSIGPDEIYALGESEVARLHAELARDVTALGFDGGDLRKSMAAALKLPAAGRDTEARRAEIVDYYTRLLDETRTRIRPLFGMFPKAQCVVKPSPRHLEARRTTTYFPAAADGSYPGWLELNLAGELDKAPWARHALAYHEAWPGHHLQLSLAQEAPHLGLFRRTFVVAAFLEGWAKYAERLPFETGIDREPRYELQRKAMELVSASNLMLDVGIHDRRWSREQAIAFSMVNGLVERGMAEYLVDRSSVSPGQLCAYTIGLSEMRRLRAGMQQRDDAHFSFPAFHDALLGEGALPLDVLREKFA